MSESIKGWFTRENGKHEPIILNDDGIFSLDSSEVILGYPISLSISIDNNDEPIQYMPNNVKFEIDPNSEQTRQNIEKWLLGQ